MSDFFHEKIGAEPYDIETVKICRHDEMNNYDKINLYCNTFNKYMKCMKEIEPPFLSAVLKDIESKIDICSILNEKENEGIDKRKTIIELEQHNVQQGLRKVHEREMKNTQKK